MNNASVDLGNLRLLKEGNIYMHHKAVAQWIIEPFLNIDAIRHLHKALIAKLRSINSTNRNRFFGVVADCGQTKGRYKDVSMLAKLMISQALSSFLFDATVENIPAVVNVNPITRARQSLGTIVVGYEKGLPPSDFVRACLKLVAERVSQVLAAEAIYELSFPLRVRRRRSIQHKILQNFHLEVMTPKANGGSAFDHGAAPVDNDRMAMLASFRDRYGEEFLRKELPHFMAMLDQLFKIDNRVDKGLFTMCHMNQNLLPKEYPILGKAGVDLFVGQSRSKIVNIALVHSLMKTMLESGGRVDTVYVDQGAPNQLLITVDELKNFSVSLLADSITGRNGAGTGSLGGFLATNYLDILAIGNLQFHCVHENNCSCPNPVLDLEADFAWDTANSSLKWRRFAQLCTHSHDKLRLVIRVDDL